MRRLGDEKDDDEPEPRQIRASLLTPPPQLIFGNSYTAHPHLPSRLTHLDLLTYWPTGHAVWAIGSEARVSPRH